MENGFHFNQRWAQPGAGLVCVFLMAAGAASLQGYTVGGTVAGMAAGQQIVLVNNGGDALTLTDNGPFVFATPLAADAGFSVTVNAQPYQEQCAVANGSGTESGANITNVVVNCVASLLSQIQSFVDVIGSAGKFPGISTADFVASPPQLVMSGGFGEVTGPQFSRNNIDPSHSKIVLGYIDVAEAAANQQPELFVNGTVPSWFGKVTAPQFGLYSVQYWNPTWEAVIFKEIDNIVVQGFDGIYLDVLYGDYDWSPNNNLGNPVYGDATPAMATLLSDIVAYVKGKKLPQFYLLGSNPMFIAEANPSSLNGLNAIFLDGLYYNVNDLNSYSGFGAQQYATLAQIYKDSGLPVFGADYPPTGNLAAHFQAFEYFTAYGWVPTVNPEPAVLTANSAVMSTGPFMFMATPTNPVASGVKNTVNFLSGGLAASATLTGGSQGDYFIGGPGTNTITGGSGNDTIYAHPANAALKGMLDIQLSATLKNGTTPSAAILINGSVALPATPITADATQFQRQDFRLDLSEFGPLSSLRIEGSNISFQDLNSYNNLYVNSVSINGAPVSFNNGVFSQSSSALNNGTIGQLNFAGTVTFSADALNVVSPLLPNNSDMIDGGGGTNTVVYRAPYSNYSITRQADGSLKVISKSTAEGPDKLVNVQVLQFPDQSITTCSYTLDLGGQAFTGAGGSGTVSINADAGCSWIVTGLPSWVQLTSSASGAGNGTITYQVAANSTGDRSVSLTIAGLSFAIEQSVSSISGLMAGGSLAQVASEGTWDFSLNAVNLGTSAATARFTFADNNGNPLALPLTFPQLPPAAGPLLAAMLDRTLSPNAQIVMQSTGPDEAATLIGSGQLLSNGNVSGFGIFSNPKPHWNAVVPLETRNASKYILAFDNTTPLTTGVAVASLAAQGTNVPVIIRDDTGTQIGNPVIPLSALGHTSFMLNDPQLGFPVTSGKRGTIEFDTPPGGQISVLGLRANGAALTTLPVLANVAASGGSITHMAFNGGWTSVFYLVNTGNASAQFTLNFFDESGTALPVPLLLPQMGTTITTAALTQTLPAGAMLVVNTQAQDAQALVIGSAQLTTSSNISGFEIFRWTTFGQEASVPMETRTPSSFVLVFDDTNGLTTGVALANLSGSSANITATFRDDAGTQLGVPATITLAAHGHTSFLLPNNYAMTAGKRGMVEFAAAQGIGISVIGLRAKSDGTLTTLPVLTK